MNDTSDEKIRKIAGALVDGDVRPANLPLVAGGAPLEGERIAKELLAEKNPPKPPPGTMPVTLNVKERNMLMGSANAYCQMPEHRGNMDQARRNKLRTLIDLDGTLDHIAEINDGLFERQREWKKAWREYNLWKDYEARLIQKDVFEKEFSEFDPENPPAKPPIREPQLTAEQKRGKERVFYIPVKLYTWIVDTLEVMDWPNEFGEYVEDLLARFGMEPQEKKDLNRKSGRAGRPGPILSEE